MSSKLGRLSREKKETVSSFAAPLTPPVDAPLHKSTDASVHTTTKESKLQSKQTVNIRMRPATMEHLNTLEQALRKAGVPRAAANSSEIVSALIHAANPEVILQLIRAPD